MNRPLRVLGALTGALSAALALTMPAAYGDGSSHDVAGPSIGRQVLPDGDGWSSVGTGTTGGSAADHRHVFTVHNRDQLAAAVAGDTPKIVYVDGHIDANTDSSGNKISCDDYARDGYTLQSYLATYDPAVWGRETVPSGPVEDARKASQEAQATQIEIKIGSNTTIVGDTGASITSAMLDLDSVSNVIIRGLRVSDAHDCFPAWDPTDGDTGNWNSEYDTISLRGATNIWVDHNDLSDGDNPDSDQPLYFGRPYQVHDGLLDITNGSDLVTASYNILHDHDKTMLIGSSDSRTSDRGKLRVTIHHNEFRDLGQRVPRVRYGQVDVYNNWYRQDPGTSDSYVYSWGVGVESHIVAEHNAFDLPADISPDRVIGNYKGTAITADGNLVNGRHVDLLAAYNAANIPQIAAEPAWSPLIRRTVQPVWFVPALVAAHAGPDALRQPQR